MLCIKIFNNFPVSINLTIPGQLFFFIYTEYATLYKGGKSGEAKRGEERREERGERKSGVKWSGEERREEA